MVEIVGYIASILVAVSLMMGGIVKLRVINLVGAVFFTVYGIIIQAFPVMAVNGFIVFVDIYYLYDIFKTKEFFRILEIKHDSEYLAYFLGFHLEEIKKYMPSYSFDTGEKSIVIFILRNSIPAGLICAERINETSLFIELDFVIPGYRDLKIGRYLYSEIFTTQHASKIYSHSGAKRHNKYLERMGFLKTELNGENVYCLNVS